MAYLNDSDFDLTIQDSNLQQIISSNEAIRQQAELVAIGEARSYLIQKYQFDTELELTGEARDPQLVNYLCDLTLYHLHSRISPRNIPQLRQDRYDNAITWLKMCATGDVTPKLLEYEVPQKMIRWGSTPKNVNNY